MTISAFSDELAQVRTKKKEFLTQIERIVPWKEWLCLIQPCYYKEKKRDPYAHLVKKGNTWHFGYKAHIGVDSSLDVSVASWTLAAVASTV